MIDKKSFLKIVTVLYDTREQRNEHILSGLNALGVRAERQKLDYGDYSFRTSTKDFSMSCVIERKANVDELYQNTMYDPERIEKEFRAGTEFPVLNIYDPMRSPRKKLNGWDARNWISESLYRTNWRRINPVHAMDFGLCM